LFTLQHRRSLAPATIKMIYPLEQDTFIVMFYYRNGAFNNDEWSCSLWTHKNVFFTSYYNVQIQETSLVVRIKDVMNKFVQIGGGTVRSKKKLE
jgi:hypothetical protein